MLVTPGSMWYKCIHLWFLFHKHTHIQARTNIYICIHIQLNTNKLIYAPTQRHLSIESKHPWRFKTQLQSKRLADAWLSVQHCLSNRNGRPIVEGHCAAPELCRGCWNWEWVVLALRMGWVGTWMRLWVTLRIWLCWHWEWGCVGTDTGTVLK